MNHSRMPSYVLLAACTAAVLAACGGGSSSSGASTGAVTPAPTPAPVVVGQSTISGTVTGFGSVIIDGIRINNAAAAAGRERDDGTVEAVELKLGQHVEVEHDGLLTATKVRVSAEAEGAVSAVDLVAGSLKVLGQVITVNTDATLGPVTVFQGYTALANVLVNDKVEVHGLIKTDAAGKVTLQATRIEKKTVADTADRVHGNISELSTTAHTFKLGLLLIDYTDAKLLPTTAVLANGTEVHVSIPLGTVAGSSAIKASVVKVRDHKAESNAKDSELGGAIATIDAASKTLTINGVKVDASAATFDQSGKTFADLKVNAYVVIKGSYGTDGILKASTIVLRGATKDKTSEAELHGSIANFVSVASFTVRGVPIDATGVVLDAASCGAASLANDLQVAVTGSMNASGQVKASAISCEKADDAHAVLSRQGVAGTVNATAKTFALVSSKQSLTVQWNADTFFRGVDATTLNGKNVEVEGTLSAGVLTATKVVFEQR
ncbi:DUF5666 domain-containing protein [Massilia sp. PWRC2]|uniref:DUF5666 domain-containing protein n=1 Tax=Massilia sp. PWRC2 TaxID=2804626 RepID=UPI003CF0B0F3